MSAPTELLITGLPRSGTTLLGALVDCLDDSFCLSEPPSQYELVNAATDEDDFVVKVLQELVDVRARLVSGESVVDRRQRDGSPLTNYYLRDGSGNITSHFDQLQHVRRQLSPAGLVAAKHNAPYTAVLPALVAKASCPIWAVVRNPVATMLSWRSLKIPISYGRLPSAERFWPVIREIADTCSDVLERQARIYELFCERYLAHADRLKIIRYEDLVKSPGMVAEALGRSPTARVDLEARHGRDPTYPLGEVDRIKEYLARYCRAAFEFYPDWQSQ